jgi:ABC-type sugar transport system ATPase subunit
MPRADAIDPRIRNLAEAASSAETDELNKGGVAMGQPYLEPLQDAAANAPETKGIPVVEVQDLHKFFGGVHAINGVSLKIWPGETVGLVGDNGSGKSTLINMLAGVYAPSVGSIVVDGQTVHMSGPKEAQGFGIETIFQDLALVGRFTVAENIFLGRELLRGGVAHPLHWMRKRAMAGESLRVLDELHTQLPGGVTSQVERMSGGQRQVIAIARGAHWSKRLLLLDEPTAALGVGESRMVLSLLRQMKGHQLAMIVITHNIEHLWEIADRIIVLRRGAKVADVAKSETDREEVVAYITGAKAGEVFEDGSSAVSGIDGAATSKPAEPK